MVTARRIIYDVATRELSVEEFEYTPPPSPPKMYRVYRRRVLSSGRTIVLHQAVEVGLTPEEINELTHLGWIVEEILI